MAGSSHTAWAIQLRMCGWNHQVVFFPLLCRCFPCFSALTAEWMLLFSSWSHPFCISSSQLTLKIILPQSVLKKQKDGKWVQWWCKHVRWSFLEWMFHHFHLSSEYVWKCSREKCPSYGNNCALTFKLMLMWQCRKIIKSDYYWSWVNEQFVPVWRCLLWVCGGAGAILFKAPVSNEVFRLMLPGASVSYCKYYIGFI